MTLTGFPTYIANPPAYSNAANQYLTKARQFNELATKLKPSDPQFQASFEEMKTLQAKLTPEDNLALRAHSANEMAEHIDRMLTSGQIEGADGKTRALSDEERTSAQSTLDKLKGGKSPLFKGAGEIDVQTGAIPTPTAAR